MRFEAGRLTETSKSIHEGEPTTYRYLVVRPYIDFCRGHIQPRNPSEVRCDHDALLLLEVA